MKAIKDMTDEELKGLQAAIGEELRSREIKNMTNAQLFAVAKAKNGEYSDEEALQALSILTEREQPNLETIATLKKMSHCEAVREKCEEFLSK